jgi:PAS domain-containing protein
VKSFFLSCLLFACSSLLVLVVIDYAVPMRTIVQVIALLLVVALITIHIFDLAFARKEMRWFLLLLTSFIVQTLVASTGGLSSPFFILFHLTAFGIGLLINANTSLLFLASSTLVLVGSMLLDSSMQSLWLHDPAATILYIVSFLSIVPLVLLLTRNYNLKDTIVALLTNQVKVDEDILAELSELVFVTDRKGNILAVNDAVEETLFKPREELLHRPLFSVLFLRDKDGMVINNDNLELDRIINEKASRNLDNLSLLATSSVTNIGVSMHIKPLAGMAGVEDQISFILSATPHMPLTVHKNLEEAIARHHAMIEELKRKLRALHLPEFYTFLVIAKTEQDILTARTLADHAIAEKKVPVDVAVLCKQAVLSEQDFAQSFHVPVQFALPHFGQQDIAPLITPLFTIASEKFTGPFFTAPCEVKYLSIAMQNLLELAILLAAKEERPSVQLAVERQGNNALRIAITATTPQIVFEKQADLFVMYYGAS